MSETPQDVLLITVTEAGRRLGIGRSSAYRLVQAGELAVVDMAGAGSRRAKLRVPADQLLPLIERRMLSAA